MKTESIHLGKVQTQDAARAAAITPCKALALPRLLNKYYSDPQFTFTLDRVIWADETDLGTMDYRVASTHQNGKHPPQELPLLKCPHHTPLLLVYNADGYYYPPILVVSRSKTADEKMGKKKARLYNLRDRVGCSHHCDHLQGGLGAGNN